MNEKWFGDSYDIVKRFFVEALRELGYVVLVDPMLTGNWSSINSSFLRFLKAEHIEDAAISGRTALLLDPDTGIGKKPSKRHTTLAAIAAKLYQHSVVFVFDQSFSRERDAVKQIQEKLEALRDLGAYGFYYDSHARFLFSSRSSGELKSIQDAFLELGLPRRRLVGLPCQAHHP